LAVNRELQKLFKCAKQQRTTLKLVPVSCPTESLLDHFKAHFNPPDPSLTTTPRELNDNIPNFVADLQHITQSVEIKDKSPDINEMKCKHPIMLQVIHRMTVNLWRDLDVPNAWGNSRFQTLWKGKGSKKDPTKYRGLSIGSTVCKLVMNIILERIRP